MKTTLQVHSKCRRLTSAGSVVRIARGVTAGVDISRSRKVKRIWRVTSHRVERRVERSSFYANRTAARISGHY
jgi:hypothetical protein